MENGKCFIFFNKELEKFEYFYYSISLFFFVKNFPTSILLLKENIIKKIKIK